MTTGDAHRLPYPGLRAYAREETDLFFGRDGCVNEMVDRLAATRFLAVLGASGSGKSSLVRTGLLDALELGLMPDAGVSWTVAECHPGSTPMHNLAAALWAAGGGAAEDAFGSDALDAFLRRGPLSIIEWLNDGHLRPGQNLLLLVDQFEELFRYDDYAGREEAEAFVALLLESTSSGAPVYVVMTMRSEYLGACALVPRFAERINESIYLTRRMTLDECREAILGPAAVLGFHIEPRLVSRLLNDLATFAPWDVDSGRSQLERLSRQADQLPLMQHVLNRLWLRATDADSGGAVTLTLADYLAIGRLQGALGQHGAEIMEELGETAAPVVEAVFRGLIAGPSLASAVRRPARMQHLEALAGGDRLAARAVVEAFRAPGANFLRPPATEALHDDTPVDISHESLIRQWSVLAGWLQDEARDAATWHGLKAHARSERDGERHLLSGRDLANAQAWWDRSRPSAAWAEQHEGEYDLVCGFLARSSMQAEKAREEQERRRRGSRNWALGAATTMTVLFAGTLVVAGLYYKANVQAEKDRNYADVERKVAESSRDYAISAADRFLTDLTTQFQDTASIPPEKLKSILTDGDQFLARMGREIGDSPQVALVQARLLLKFSELSLEDDLRTTIDRLDRARTLLANDAVSGMQGAYVLQAESYRLSAAAALVGMDKKEAEARARKAVGLFDRAIPRSDDDRLAASRAHRMLSRVLADEKEYGEAQIEADACLAMLAGLAPTNNALFARANCIHAKAIPLSDDSEAKGDESGLQSAQELYGQESRMLDQLMTSDPANIAFMNQKSFVLNNVASPYRTKQPMRFVEMVEQAASLSEQALQRAPWSVRLKSSLAHYDYWIGKTLLEIPKPVQPVEARPWLAKAREIRAGLASQDLANTRLQDDYDDALSELRSDYLATSKVKLTRAEIDDWVAVSDTLLKRHIDHGGSAPSDIEAIFDVVEDHARLAEALRAAGRPGDALEQARSGAELVDRRAFEPGADPRFRYWAHWLRQVGSCNEWVNGDADLATMIDYCEGATRFVGDHLEREPRDWLNRGALANARNSLAGMYLEDGRKQDALATMQLAAEGGSEAATRTLATWYRTGEGAAPIDLAKAGERQHTADTRAWGMKKFTIPAKWWSQDKPNPTEFYIRNPAFQGQNTLEEEIYRVEVIETLALPDDVKTSFRKLWTIAAGNNVSFMDLCVYALGQSYDTAPSERERIFASRTGANGKAEVQSSTDGTFNNLSLAVEAVQEEWVKPNAGISLKSAFDDTAKMSNKAPSSLVHLAQALDVARLYDAADLAMTPVLNRVTPFSSADLLAILYNQRAGYRKRAGRIDDALLDYAEAATLQPDNGLYANSLGYTRLERDIALPATAELLERAWRLKPDSIDIKESVGWAYVKTSRVEQGLDLLRQVIAAWPDAPEPYAHLADGLRRLGRTAEARDALAAASTRRPSASLAEFIAQQNVLLGKE